MNDKILGIIGVFSIILYLLFKIIPIFAIVIGVIIFIGATFFITIRIIKTLYFRSKTFKHLKNALNENTKECNELNNYISELKSHIFDFHAQDYGESSYNDTSIYNYKRPLFSYIRNNSNHEHYCSLSVCKNAQNQPFKYLCKYFNIIPNELTLNRLESMFNNFSAAEDAENILLKNRKEILTKYNDSIPFVIRKYWKELLFKELGYEDINFSDLHFPRYCFIYVSAGGQSSMNCNIILDCKNLEKFIAYINKQIQLSKTIEYQRALMTKRLRREIKIRDNYTCQICGISVKEEPHLLLEIDHIIPLSKGGLSTLNNLQTLCWHCNRKKGASLV